MEPSDLRPEEVEYELNLRGVFNLTGAHSVRSQKLKQILRKERLGEITCPATSHLPAFEDLGACEQTLRSILLTLEEQKQNPKAIEELVSRTIHLERRVDIIRPQTGAQTLAKEDLLVKLEEWGSRINEMSDKFQKDIEAHKASEPVGGAEAIWPTAQRLSRGRGRPLSTGGATSTPDCFEYLRNLNESNKGFPQNTAPQAPPNTITNPTDRTDATYPQSSPHAETKETGKNINGNTGNNDQPIDAGEPVQQLQNLTLDESSTSNPFSRGPEEPSRQNHPYMPLFQSSEIQELERLFMQRANSLMKQRSDFLGDTFENGSVAGQRKGKRVSNAWQNELWQPEQTKQMVSFDVGTHRPKTVGQNGSYDIMKENQRYLQRLLMTKQAFPVAKAVERPDKTPRMDVAKVQHNYGWRVGVDHQENPINSENRTQQYGRDGTRMDKFDQFQQINSKWQYRETEPEYRYQEEKFTMRSNPYQEYGSQQNIRQQGQEVPGYRDPRATQFYPNSGRVLKTDPYNQWNHTEPRTMPSMDIGRNYGVPYENCDSRFLQSYARRESFNEDHFGYPGYRNTGMRKAQQVPVNKWKICFSGEAKKPNELGIHDFLEQLEMFRRAEQLTEDDLLYEVAHLLRGRARAWFTVAFREITSWQHFVWAIKKKFLPEDYSFVLLAEIESRLQRKDESVSSYINEMELKYRALPIHVDEQQKIYTIKKNLLSDYIKALGPARISSMAELEATCRRWESSRNMLQARFHGHSSGNKHTTNNTYRTQPRTKYVAELEAGGSGSSSDETGFSESENEEVCLVDRNKRFPRSDRKKRDGRYVKSEKSEPSTENAVCYNCLKQGHSHRQCQEEKGIFCYICGQQSVKANDGHECKKNSKGDSPKESPSN